MDSPEKLLEHATWLRRLAASLVNNATSADDLVQDTWAAALQRSPETDRPLRPWLARVVRNAARFRWRSDKNRTSRESVVAGDAERATPTSEDLLARHELQQLLARLVGELDEPFRATILLRYAEGLEPTQIARRLGIPASTVRWRIKEALERLRRGLDMVHESNRKTWMLALAPIALWPRASHASPAATAAGIMAVAIAGAAIILGILHRRSPDEVSAQDQPAAGAATRAPHGAGPSTPSWFVQAGVAPRHVTGRVVRSGVPVPDAEVRLIADDADPVELRSDAQGRFDFGQQSAREVTLGAGAGDALGAIRHLDLRDPLAATDIELELTACNAWIGGKVADAGGNPISHARVLREDAIGTVTDASGAYELCALPTAALVSQLSIVVRADGYGAVAAGVAPAGRIVRDFVLAPEATITGTAIPGAAIWIEPDRDDLSLPGERATRQVAIADGDGRFRFTGASGGRYRVGGAAHGMLAMTTLVSVGAGGTADVALRMNPAATVHGRVVAHGVPVAGAHVALQSDALERESVAVRHDDPSMDMPAVRNAVTQSDGSFVLDGVPVGRTTFSAIPVRVVSPPTDLVAGDNTVALEGIPLGRIRGAVLRHGAPVPYARVDIGGLGKRGGLTADSSGHYEVDGLEPGEYGFYADDGKRGAFFTAANLVKLGEGETRNYDIELAWGARVAGTVVDRSGAPLPNLNVRFSAADGEEARCSTDASGGFACASLQGDKSYTAAVFPADNASRPFPFVIAPAKVDLAADASVGPVVLTIDPRTLAVSGVVVDDAGAPVVDARVLVRGNAQAFGHWVNAPTAMTDTDGRFRIDRLPPGEYELRAETMHDARNAKRVVAAGTKDIVVALARPKCIANGSLSPAHKPASSLVWDDRIELLGWDMPSIVRAGEPVEVTLVFRVRAPLLHSWRVFAHFDTSAAGNRRNADHDPVGESCGTTTWRPGDVLIDRFSTTLPVAEPYTLKIGFFRPSDGDGPWLNLAGPGDATDGFELGTVTVTPAEAPTSPSR
jgi:RNA polymerase sigma-70 factor (ECF subfamily)